MANLKDMRLLVRQAIKAGCSVERRSSGHTRIYAPNGAFLDVSFSPGTHRGVRVQQIKVRKFIKENCT